MNKLNESYYLSRILKAKNFLELSKAYTHYWCYLASKSNYFLRNLVKKKDK